MRVVTGAGMREIDRISIEEKKIPGIILMEAAGKGVADEIWQRYPEAQSVLIIAGKGNNGGDAFVVHRWLAHWGYECTTLLLAPWEEIQGDARTNLEILYELGAEVIEAVELEQVEEFWADLADYDLIVDGILGTGLKGEVRGISRWVIQNLDRKLIDQRIVAIDIPSGLDAERGIPLGVAVQADLTVTFALPKLGLLLNPGQRQLGDLVVIDIGIPAQVVAEVENHRYWVTEELCSSLLPTRDPEGHKGTYGHALILAGSRGMTGAAALSCLAALRSGCGLVTLGIAESLNQIMEVKLTEVMTAPMAEQEGRLSVAALEQIDRWVAKVDVVGVGPGLGQSEDLAQIMKHLIQTVEKPLVIDADGLNNLRGHLEFLKERKSLTIITPHPGEMARLVGKNIAEVQADRVGVAEGFAQEYGVIVVLKGSVTITAFPDGRTYLNSTGNEGMGTGGSGDILTGMIVGMLAQNPEPICVPAAVYIHGLAGDLQVARGSSRSLIAGDLLEGMALAFNHLKK